MPGSWDGGDTTVNDGNTAPAPQKLEAMPGADKARTRVHIKCGEVSNPGLLTFSGDVHTSADTWIFSRGDVDSFQTSINNFHTLSGFMDSVYTDLYEKQSRNSGLSRT